MNKTELIAQIAEKSNLTKKDAEAALAATLDSIAGAMAAGDKVQLMGFGAFEVKHRDARTGRNPKTGEAMEIAASNVPSFKAGKALKDQMAK